FTENVKPLSVTIASQLTSLPLASPYSGISFTFDKSLGIFIAAKEGYGPILSESARTVGRHRLSVGFAYQFFNLDSLDGVNLRNFPSLSFQNDLVGDGTGTPLITCTVNGGQTIGQPSGVSAQNRSNVGVCSFIRDYISAQNRVDFVENQYTVSASFGLTDRI